LVEFLPNVMPNAECRLRLKLVFGENTILPVFYIHREQRIFTVWSQSLRCTSSVNNTGKIYKKKNRLNGRIIILVLFSITKNQKMCIRQLKRTSRKILFITHNRDRGYNACRDRRQCCMQQKLCVQQMGSAHKGKLSLSLTQWYLLMRWNFGLIQNNVDETERIVVPKRYCSKIVPPCLSFLFSWQKNSNFATLLIHFQYTHNLIKHNLKLIIFISAIRNSVAAGMSYQQAPTTEDGGNPLNLFFPEKLMSFIKDPPGFKTKRGQGAKKAKYQDATITFEMNPESWRFIAYACFWFMVIFVHTMTGIFVKPKLLAGPSEDGDTCPPFSISSTDVDKTHSFDIKENSHLYKAFGFNNVRSWKYYFLSLVFLFILIH